MNNGNRKLTTPDGLLPQNLAAERSVLGAILIDETGKALAKAHQHIRSSGDFFLPQNRVIFSEMLAMADAQKAIDPLTLSDHLRAKALLERAGGVAYVESLADGIPRINNIEDHAEIVAEKARRRLMAHVMYSYLNSALEDGETPVAELQNRLEKDLREMATTPANGNGNGNGHFAYLLPEFMATDFLEPEHLIEGLIPRNNNSIIIAMPHHLKSYLMLGLALAATRAGLALGRLEVKKPVRTLIMQVEEYNGEFQNRLKQFLRCPQFQGCDVNNICIVPRTSFDKDWYPKLLHATKEFGADWVILDVLRRFFVGHGDLNGPKDSAVFLEKMDDLRDIVGCHVSLVHHENRKDADITAAAAGSYNFQGWAKTWIRLKRKLEDKKKGTTSVEIEVDTALTSSPEPMRLVLDFGSAENHLRLENLEDDSGFRDVMEALASEWTVRDVAEHKGVHRTNAWRLVKKWLDEGRVEKIRGRKGRGGMAAYREIEITQDSKPD